MPLSTKPPVAAADDGGSAGGARRWTFWRSPAGQPAWARPALLGIAALAALLYAWNLRTAGYAPFYSVAVKSMSVSWKAFFYGALDPGATITIDKLAGSFLPQALSARIFGFHQWSLALPQVIEGVVAVLAMFRIVRRWLGPAAGLIAAAVFAFTPIIASMFGHSMEDGALTMCLVLAADAYQRAVVEGRLRSLLLAGVWVGLGFQAKMLQAWMILPALAIGYLVAAPPRLGRRIGHLLTAGAVMLAVSMSWIALYTLTPAQDRPYVDGSTNNSAVAMVFGYNGLGRFGVSVPGAVAGFGTGGPAGGAPAGRAATAQPGQPTDDGTSGRAAVPRQAGPGGGGDGLAKLAGQRYGAQIGWLYPAAFLTLAIGLVWRRKAPRTDLIRGGLLMWGVWLVTTFAVFSAITIPHTAYMATLAPPLAALTAAGITLGWRAYRDRRSLWALPTLIGVEAAWTVYLASETTFLPWLTPVVVLAALLAIGALLAGRFGFPSHRRLLRAGLATGVVAMLVTPGAWAASVLKPAYAGSSFDAAAGPSSGFGPGSRSGSARPLAMGPPGGMPSLTDRQGQPFGGGFPPPTGSGARRIRFGGAGGGLGGAADTLDVQQQRLVDYLRAHRDGATYLFAVDSWSTASPYITATGERIMPMGGFSGSVPQPTLAQVKALVANGKLRYLLLGGARGMGSGDGASATAQISAWARSTCQVVPASDYGDTTTTTADQPPTQPGQPGQSNDQTSQSQFPGAGARGQTLLRCGR